VTILTVVSASRTISLATYLHSKLGALIEAVNGKLKLDRLLILLAPSLCGGLPCEPVLPL
jgi:hypothetical protein